MEVVFTIGKEVRLFHSDGAYNEGEIVKIHEKHPWIDVDFFNWTERFKRTSFAVMYSHFMDAATGDFPEFLAVTARGVKLDEFVKVRQGEQ